MKLIDFIIFFMTVHIYIYIWNIFSYVNFMLDNSMYTIMILSFAWCAMGGAV